MSETCPARTVANDSRWMPCARRTGFGSPVLSEQPPSRGLMYAVARYAHSDGTEIQTRTRSLSFGSPFLAGIAGGLDDTAQASHTLQSAAQFKMRLIENGDIGCYASLQILRIRRLVLTI